MSNTPIRAILLAIVAAAAAGPFAWQEHAADQHGRGASGPAVTGANPAADGDFVPVSCVQPRFPPR